MTRRSPAASAPAKPLPVELTPGTTLEKLLQGGETQTYAIRAEKNAFVHATVEQHGIDVALTFTGPDGKPIASMDSPNGQFGLEQISILSDAAGLYIVEIASGDKTAPAGKYKVRFDAPRAPTEQDKIRLRAESIFMAAGALDGQQTADAWRAASKKYEESAPFGSRPEILTKRASRSMKPGASAQMLGELDRAKELGQQALELADRSRRAGTSRRGHQ